MARKTSKEDAKSSEPPVGSISIEEFNLTRDRVVHGLSHLQVAVSNLLTAYLEHCKTISGEGGGPIDATALASIAGLNFGDVAATPLLPSLDAKGKKKKQKKERDPNAPKRPLTAAFLFGQSARQIVKHDLEVGLQPGDKLGPNAVNEEVTRRWNALDDASKEAWKEEYRKNLVTYREKLATYEASKLAVHDEDADGEGEAEDAVAGAAAVDSDAEGSSDEESAKEPSPPPKQPTPPPPSAAKNSKRRKTGKEPALAANGATPSGMSEVPLPGAASSSRASIVPLPGAAGLAPTPMAAEKTKKAPAKKAVKAAESPEVPKKRATKKEKDAAAAAAAAAASSEEVAVEPEKKKATRKRKADS